MENLVLILVVLTSISVILQMIFLVAAFFRVRRISNNVDRLSQTLDERTTPLLVELKETAGDTRELLKTLQASAENFRGISESVKSQVEQVNAAIEDASTRARNQIAKVDGVISDAVLRVEATTLIIQQPTPASIAPYNVASVGWAEARRRETAGTVFPICRPRKFSPRRTKIAWKGR